MTQKSLADSVERERSQAEAGAREFIKQKHSRVERIFLRTVYRERNTWVLHGEVQFKRAYFFGAERSFRLQINPETGEVASYEEHAVSRRNEVK
ncbi:hypothetical protein IBX38_02010 [Candidatus Bathyarchaeota archaeon]|nr:hypothetical protein [Candidatus Bathyarchaeota archaeon]